MPDKKTLSISEFLLSHRDGGAVEDLAEKVVESAFKKVVAEVEKLTGIPVYLTA